MAPGSADGRGALGLTGRPGMLHRSACLDPSLLCSAMLMLMLCGCRPHWLPAIGDVEDAEPRGGALKCLLPACLLLCF